MLEAICDICSGKVTETVVNALYLRIELLENDLRNDQEALNWFDVSTPAFSAPLTPPLRPTLLPGQ